MEEYQEHSLSNRVFQKIRDNILNGVYKEQDELRENTIGKELGVSRTPVREALRQLECNWLIRQVLRFFMLSVTIIAVLNAMRILSRYFFLLLLLKFYVS